MQGSGNRPWMLNRSTVADSDTVQKKRKNQQGNARTPKSKAKNASESGAPTAASNAITVHNTDGAGQNGLVASANLSIRSQWPSVVEDLDNRECEEEESLRWAALERLPTFNRVRRGILQRDAGEYSEVDVSNLTSGDRTALINRLLSDSGDPERFFQRIRQRFDAVNLEFPKIEVRFQELKVDAYVHTGSRALPTIPNFIFNMTEAFLRQLKIFPGRRKKLSILNNISGMVQPSRMTLLLGPPSSGKTTLLLALSGRLGSDLQISGNITYNGHRLNEFVPQRTSAYVSQQDWHAAEMTVRETLEFSGRCQGMIPLDMLMELTRREKEAGIKPDEDLDIFMKALALEGKETSLVVEYIMKILGLDICADTLVGDEMIKGISGGQKKRLTTGELLVGPARVLLMDEISTGLDSSTTYQIIKYLRHSTHALDGTTIISLLQPAPETFELFDDIILISEGQIVYQGPGDGALDFFASMGFRCPERKNVSDFLQEVISMKDQQQYWYSYDRPYQFIPVEKFAEAFSSYHVGRRLKEEMKFPYNKEHSHPAALSTSSYGVKRFELLKANFAWQWLLMKRNSFIYIFKFIQLLLVAIITMTVFYRSTMHHDNIDDGIIYLGALYFAAVMILFNGFTEVALLIAKLPVLYKHRDLHFYPPWTYSLPSWVLSILTSFIESAMWVAVTYYVVGYDPHITRFFGQLLLLFFLHQMSLALFRVMASLGRNMIVSNTFGSFAMLVVMILGGFIVSRDSIPSWWIWGYWISPLMYAQNAGAVNEFLGHSWDKKVGSNTIPLGKRVLKGYGLFTESYWFWIGVGALLGYTVMLNVLFTLFLTYLNQKNGQEKKGMVLPFQPLTMCFSNINYYVDVPMELKKQGILEDRLQLLVNVTGAFRPGILTALVGVSGAGKTTLMDVLAGRKTGGLIEGSITISGYPKNQKTFARVSGYCEQNDIHSPCLTVIESLIFSALLRLPSLVDQETQKLFVEEIMELVELSTLRDALVGLPSINGLSTEQRKRLTIAVELVANPSIIFMDEPTSGLDARAAAIVMRTVRNIVNTGRTIVCTIHQPSIDIFESFDELLFMKRGGELIYAGPLGTNSCKLIEYFEAIPGIPKIKDGYNPAAWMLEVTNPVMENHLGVDFADYFRKSKLFQQSEELVEHLSVPDDDTKDLSFPTKYSRPFFSQFIACLWKQNLSYWRNPQYTAVRFFYTVIISLMFGTICWGFGSKRSTQQEIFNAMGSMYTAVLFIGITNGTAVQPVVYIERFVSYRERAAGMYSALSFAFAQVSIEFPYVLVQTLIYGTIFYSFASFEWTLLKFLCHQVAPIIAAPFYTLWNLFSGFVITRKRIPGWWRWYYWANPVSWSLYGLLTSQFGDIEAPLMLGDGIHKTSVKAFLENHFGFRHDFLGVAGIMVVCFCIIFGVVFAFGIKSLNFQRR
ncbi:Pleiotropic drug resistance protein 6 [Apostasia shenzhenica]|uniref:Pleiotropic drug resistance protein 6 n=1 Tax=Apostasia shenzhenica TaxID=1088818 RepID=A0A2I0B9Q7_9ASPA|nr:Pleiotropic drug resistance protein 6 [Apostasia shenzhenica]